MTWWAIIGSFLSKVFSALIGRWLIRRGAKKEAKVEVALEVNNADRKRANEIRDRVDTGRVNHELHSDPTDKRGYRD